MDSIAVYICKRIVRPEEHIAVYDMISVIVITYNAERSIARCIDSIINQTFKDIELIILNDGSTDKTLSIINSYKEIDNRLIIISRENRGVARSRQEGLDLSKGEFSVFVDSDDWVEPDFLEALYNKAIATKSDMVICDMFVEWGNRTEYSCQKPRDEKADTIFGQMFMELHGSLCNKLIAKSAYIRSGVRMPNFDCCEDQYVVMLLLSNNISVSYCNRALYHYDKAQNDASITNKWSNFKVSKRIEFIKSIRSLVRNEYQAQCYDNYIGAIAYSAAGSPKVACPNYRELFEEFWTNIRRSNLPKCKKIICLLRIRGIVIPVRFIRSVRLYLKDKVNLKRYV